MKAAVIFSLFFCLHLLCGYGVAQASIHQPETGSSPVQTNETIQRAGKALVHQAYSPAKYDELLEEADDPVGIEAEDDDDDEDGTRRQTALTRYVASFFHPFLLSPASAFTNENFCFSQPFAGINSRRYIAHRSLRI